MSNVIHSQVDLHKEFGGVVPELAARDHLERLPQLVELAMDGAGAEPSDLDLIAVTRGPGLAGCLLVGVGVAEGLAAAWSKPLTGVNHLWGHIYAAVLTEPDLKPPLLGLVVSGAHSDLVRMPEARRQPLPRPSLAGLEYSFSGLKTALLYRLRDLGDKVTPQDRADLAAAFERSVVESLLEKLDQALRSSPSSEVVVCGGVAANTLLRKRAAEVVAGRARLTMPPLDLCTDNAAMIGAVGFHTSSRPAAVDPSLGW